jgi:hypothetical protein
MAVLVPVLIAGHFAFPRVQPVDVPEGGSLSE